MSYFAGFGFPGTESRPTDQGVITVTAYDMSKQIYNMRKQRETQSIYPLGDYEAHRPKRGMLALSSTDVDALNPEHPGFFVSLNGMLPSENHRVIGVVANPGNGDGELPSIHIFGASWAMRYDSGGGTFYDGDIIYIENPPVVTNAHGQRRTFNLVGDKEGIHPDAVLPHMHRLHRGSLMNRLREVSDKVHDLLADVVSTATASTAAMTAEATVLNNNNNNVVPAPVGQFIGEYIRSKKAPTPGMRATGTGVCKMATPGNSEVGKDLLDRVRDYTKDLDTQTNSPNGPLQRYAWFVAATLGAPNGNWNNPPVDVPPTVNGSMKTAVKAAWTMPGMNAMFDAMDESLGVTRDPDANTYRSPDLFVAAIMCEYNDYIAKRVVGRVIGPCPTTNTLIDILIDRIN